MRIVSFSALFPPYSHGGAENSAANLARWLASQGHEVHVISAATKPDDVVEGGVMDQGVRVWRRAFPRPYPVYRFPTAPAWLKPVWHLQDHFDPRNRSIVAGLLDRIEPDAAVIHYLPGIGYNVLKEIAARDIPATYYLHDLGLACVRMSMFKKGHDCGQPCSMCRTATGYKSGMLAEFSRIGFCSPSRTNLERVLKFVDLKHRPSTFIPNARRYDPPTRPRSSSPLLRLMYVGRLHPQKGVEVALEAVRRLPPGKVSVRIVGGGQIEAELRREYGREPWCSFTGHIAPEAVANEMVDADVLLVPSVWAENLPGVAIQALGLGIPVLGSEIGGIPELVKDGVNGKLLPPGDVDAWHRAMAYLLAHPEVLQAMRAGALETAKAFDQDALGARHLAFLQGVKAAVPTPVTASATA